ncbi:hypothetical protein AS4_06310 [Acinetobacter guillouiae]|uniref:hypothetical protein n=1 Tax=Acinetobacter guillouiae TaxID=106649 RepID=UPI0004EF615F|nr:hypothetical protein [Acinetobacter guillouiae]BAP35571.1 hypothetical protein AS4_06310 [Acinetobacter guillouiae]
MKNILLQNNEYPIIASPMLCKELGLPAATFLQKLYYLLNETRKYKRKKNLTQHNNRKWWFHTYEDWTDTLGFFSISTIKRAVAKLKQMGLIEINKLDPNKSMRVNYYTINYKKLKELFGISIAQTKPVAEPKAVTETIVGTNTPTQPEATPEQLAIIPSQHRALYQQLRQYKLDIAYNDPRLHFWDKKTRSILAYTASACNRLNINKWQWHTPEQVLPENLIRI